VWADGKRLAAGEHAPGWSASRIHIWDVESGKELHGLDGGDTGVVTVAFSREGHTLATAGIGGVVRFWDADSGLRRALPIHHPASVRSIAFVPGGKTLVSGCDDYSVRFWDLDAVREKLRCVGHTATVESVSVSKNGRLIASAVRDEIICLWDAAGKELGRLRGHKGHVLSVAFAPDGKTLAS